MAKGKREKVEKGWRKDVKSEGKRMKKGGGKGGKGMKKLKKT